MQEDIRQSEYHVTWQDQTYLAALPAPSAGLTTGAYQAPNRAHNLRTYFTPEGIRVIPRVTADGDQRSVDGVEGNAERLTTNHSAPPTIPWEWGLTLIGYGYAEDVRPVSDAELAVSANRVEYRRDTLTEWYVNDERGLEQGFTLAAPPLSAIQNPKSKIVLDLALTGDLTPNLVGAPPGSSGQNGQAIEFTTSGGVRVLRYSDLLATDATGSQLSAHLSLIEQSNAIRITLDAAHATYPITVDPLATTPNWTAESNQANAQFGQWLGTAGDVNGDGYADVIVGASHYDNGQTDEGRAYVYHGSASGLSASPNWTAESNQDGAWFGRRVGTAGDVNDDGYADVIVGATRYDNGETDEGRAYVYYGSAAGLSTAPDW
ncbi:MAG: integrin alpha, partial [Anaerolineae bacterium]